MFDPVEIFIAGGRLENWTQFSLSRSKEELTGTASVTIFQSGSPPLAPVMTQIAKGVPIKIYIGGHLALNGTIDKRTGAGDTTSYNVTISARGKTKVLIDGSHQNKTGTMLKPTSKTVVDDLIRPHNIKTEWKAEEQKLERAVFRDGAIISDELHRVGSENAHFIYENRKGELRVTDDTARENGAAILLGVNILSFSAEQSEDIDKSEITVKGKRNSPEIRGKASMENTIKKVKNASVKTKTPLVIHHYGDGNEKALERRAVFEANKRNSASMNVQVDVFHVQNANGEPWDVGLIHNVSIPCEGVSGPMECTALEYTADNSSTLKTSLTLSPLPSAGLSSSSGSTGLQLAANGISVATTVFGGDSYPSPWTGPVLTSEPIEVIADIASSILSGLQRAAADDNDALTLPGYNFSNENSRSDKKGN